MTRDLLVSQLRQGATGAEILQILEVLTAGMDPADAGMTEPTLEEVQF